jgi:hypothetical protein
MALTKRHIFEGHLGKPKGIKVNNYMVFDDKVHQVHKIVVHKFTLSDVEDPDLYAAEPILKWQNSDVGRWIMERSVEIPMWHRHHDVVTYGYQYAIVAWLKGPDYTYWQLKWATP